MFMKCYLFYRNITNNYFHQESTGELIRTLNSGHQIQWISESRLVYTTINRNMRPDTATSLDLKTGELGTSNDLWNVLLFN